MIVLASICIRTTRTTYRHQRRQHMFRSSIYRIAIPRRRLTTTISSIDMTIRKNSPFLHPTTTSLTKHRFGDTHTHTHSTAQHSTARETDRRTPTRPPQFPSLTGRLSPLAKCPQRHTPKLAPRGTWLGHRPRAGGGGSDEA